MTAPNDPGMETPVSPLAETDAPVLKRTRGGMPKRSKKSRASAAAPAGGASDRGPIASGFAFILASWRVLVFIVFVQLLLGLTVVLPFWQTISERLDTHPHAASLAGSPTAYDKTFPQWKDGGLDPGIWRDIKREDKVLFDSLTTTAYWMALIAWLFGALVAGGFLGTAVSGEDPVRVGSFLTHGARLYGPMLRVGLCFALCYYLTIRLVFEAWGASVASTEFMDASEAAGFWGARLREGVAVLLFFVFTIAADRARASLAVRGTRGAVGAFFRGLGATLCGKGWVTALAIAAPTYAILLGLGFASQALAGDERWILISLFVVMQLAVFVRWAGRAARLAALAKLP